MKAGFSIVIEVKDRVSFKNNNDFQEKIKSEFIRLHNLVLDIEALSNIVVTTADTIESIILTCVVEG